MRRKNVSYVTVEFNVYAESSRKKGFLSGTAEKVGNMPDRTVYSLSDKGKDELLAALKVSVLQFHYDTNIFSIAAFFLDVFPPNEQRELLQKRLNALQKYREGIENQVNPLWEDEVSAVHCANVKRMIDLVDAEITGTNRLLESVIKEVNKQVLYCSKKGYAVIRIPCQMLHFLTKLIS